MTEGKLFKNHSYKLQIIQMMLNDERAKSNYVTCIIAGKWVQAKLYDEPSTFGINDGRVSKLCVGKSSMRDQHKNFFDQMDCNYDRGWDFNNLSEKEVGIIVTALEKLPPIEAIKQEDIMISTPKEINHSERAHAKLSASGSAIWLNCPGSVEAQEPYEDKGSLFAEEGTMAHEVADICLSTGNDADAYIGRTLKSLKIKLSRYKPSHKIERIMAEYVQEYLDYVRAHETENSTLYTEQRVDFSNVVPGGFGTLDSAVLVYDERMLHIFDLKYGKGVTVDAFENTQGQMYGTGFLNEYGFLDAFDTIRIHIVQPRKSNFSHWDITVKDLITFGKFVAERAAFALTKNAPRVPGDKQCQWCDARFDCNARKLLTENTIRAKFDELDDNPPDANILTIEQKSLILRHKKLIEKFLKDIEKSAYSTLSNGDDFPGMKLVRGTSNRVIPSKDELSKDALELKKKLSDDVYNVKLENVTPEARAKLISDKKLSDDMYDLKLQVVEDLEELGEEAYNKKLKGIGDLEKLLGKKEVAAIAVRPEGKIVMVEESDKRPAIIINSVISQFDNMD